MVGTQTAADGDGLQLWKAGVSRSISRSLTMGGTPVFVWGGRPTIAHSQKLACVEISQKF